MLQAVERALYMVTAMGREGFLTTGAAKMLRMMEATPEHS